MALFKIIRNQTDNGRIIGLRENTNYMINVQAINTAGNGPKSENYRTKTLRAGERLLLCKKSEEQMSILQGFFNMQ